ncbi:MAG: zinc ribbon domain-containing protein [Chthoniobacterales bacterium]
MALKKTTPLAAPQVCPVCGEDVPPRALACPECGADHNSGWKEDADRIDAVDLPDEDFNYAEFVQQEFGSSLKAVAIKPLWWIVALILIVAFVAMYFFSAGR